MDHLDPNLIIGKDGFDPDQDYGFHTNSLDYDLDDIDELRCHGLGPPQ